MNNCVSKFFEFYVKGDLISAVAQIIPSPHVSYETFSNPNNFQQTLINFVDASVFRNLREASIQNIILAESMSRHLQEDSSYPSAAEMLHAEDQFLYCLFHDKEDTPEIKEQMPHFFLKLLTIEKEQRPLNKTEIDFFLKEVPATFQTLLKFQLAVLSGWQKFKKAQPTFCNNLSIEYQESHPWYPIQYNLPLPLIEKDVTNKIPIIFFEPIQDDLSKFLQKFEKRPAIFAFLTVSNFFQMLQFPNFVESLCSPMHLSYILELYPNLQLASQNLELIKSKELFPILFSQDSFSQSYVPVFIQALKECLKQTRNELNIDTSTSNWVYEVSKRWLASLQYHRLGLLRAPALYMHLSQKKWHDRHKGLPPANKPLGPEEENPLKEIFSILAKKRAVRATVSKDKILLAHIVPQLVSGGHAPTRILQNLVLNHDRNKFEMIVVSTEALNERSLEYPYHFYSSDPSKERGAQIINDFEKVGVKVFLKKNSYYFIPNAFQVCDLLNECKVDVAVFHGPDIINLMTTQMINAPLRVLFEHGTQSEYSGFDLAILSSIPALEIYGEIYKKLNIHPIALPFALDVRKEWLPQPFTKKSLGLPENSLVMTTISTKLDIRLTDELCHAIATILKRVPEACYAPIGGLRNAKRIEKIFAEYGVNERFYPLGDAEISPSQYARSMHLYLNEFPVGGGLAILEAMAAGCPVVTMYDEKGPQQARYGGNYMGIERAIPSGKTKDYINLACQLLTDPKMYKEWSEHSIKQYEKFSDVKRYVKSFEDIILTFFS